MGRPKVSQRKIKTGITLDPELFDWIQSKIATKEFSNLTHAVERGLLLLKEKMEGKKK
jgi:Arc/MetJ-type ribon-helix-helix transcriptional regulator